MKIIKLIQYALLLAVVTFSSCKKYGYEIEDGFADASSNVADGQLDTNMKLVDKSMYAQARIFPGLVGDSEPRVGINGVAAGKFTLNLNFGSQTRETLRFAYAPNAMLSTGYYAAPGELVRIDVPPGVDGLMVQIGIHTQDLNSVAIPRRSPVIFARKQLYTGQNFIRNLFGGNIYIVASRQYGDTQSTAPYPVEFTISNACKSPDFVLGESTDANWLTQVRNSTVPWLEFRTKHVIWTMPRDFIIQKINNGSRPLTSPQQLMTEWNKVFDQHFDKWMGLSDDAQDPRDRLPAAPWRATVDIQMESATAAGVAGYPFMALANYDSNMWLEHWTDLTQLTTNLPRTNWSTYHELGHNSQQTYYTANGSYKIWEWSTLTEVTCNVFSFKVAKAYGIDFSLLRPDKGAYEQLALAHVAKTGAKNFDTDFPTDALSSGNFSRLCMFIQLMECYGYGWFTELHKKGRRLERPNLNDQARKDYFYEFMSDYVRKDMAPFFQAWGVSLSAVAQNTVAAKYPTKVTETVWNYNIIKRIGAISASSQQTAGPSINLSNGITNDFWLSQNSSYPVSLVFFVGTPKPDLVTPAKDLAVIKGVTVVQGPNSANYARQVEVLVSEDNINYTSAGTMQLPQNTTPYEYNFPTGVKRGKYIKLIIRTGAGTAVALGEVSPIFE